MGLDEFNQEELQRIKENLAQEQDLLKQYEDELRFTTDPREKARITNNIKRQKAEITKYKQQYLELQSELSNLSSNAIETPKKQVVSNTERNLNKQDLVDVGTRVALKEEIRMPKKQKILILTAIPHGLRLDKEMREVEGAIRRATKRDLFEITSRTAVRPQDIRRAIAEEKPQVVHFCGHGIEDSSLVLEDNAGNNKPVSPNALASLFKLHADYVKCVLLNACYSEKSAEAINQHIDYVIGMNNPIQDNSAIEFARGFYDGLGYEIANDQNIFERAFDEAMVAIEMENFAQAQIPILKKNFK